MCISTHLFKCLDIFWLGGPVQAPDQLSEEGEGGGWVRHGLHGHGVRLRQRRQHPRPRRLLWLLPARLAHPYRGSAIVATNIFVTCG